MSNEKISLSVNVFSDWNLTSPFWVASAYLSDSQNALKKWIPIKPSAITLKTTAIHERQRSTGVERTTAFVHVSLDPMGRKDRAQKQPNLYCDGEPKDEFLSVLKTNQLLAFAKQHLPETKVGISVLMGEDYQRLANDVVASDFVELNLKYSARIRNQTPLSYFDAHRSACSSTLDEVNKFCDTFEHVPLFIKVTRETPWLGPGRECYAFLDSLVERNKSSQRVGLIVANTKKTRIPANLVIDRRFHDGELAGGVLAGEHLYIDTYNIIRDLIACHADLPVHVPIVATGGITALSSFVEAIHAGAVAAQMYTAFHAYSPDFYNSLEDDLRKAIEVSRLGSYMEMLRLLQRESDPQLKPLRFHVVEVSRRNRREMERQLESKAAEIVVGLADRVTAELRRDTKSLVLADTRMQRRRLQSAIEAGIPSFSSYSVQNSTSTDHAFTERVRIVCARSSFEGHVLLKLLETERSEHYDPKSCGRGRELIEQLLGEESWDFALVPEVYFDELAEQGADALDAGTTFLSNFYLFSAEDRLENVNEILNFGGRESRFALQLADRADQIKQSEFEFTVVRTDELLFWALNPRAGTAFLAKEPACTIYKILAEARQPMHLLVEIEIPVSLIVSRHFLEKVDSAGLIRVYSDLNAVMLNSHELSTQVEKRRMLHKEVMIMRDAYLRI